MLAILLQIIFAVGIIFQRLAIEMPFLITGLTLIVTLIFIISYWKIKRSAKLKPCQEDFSRRSFIEDLDTSIATSTSDDSEESEAEEHDELINQDSGLASTIASNNSSLNRYAIKMLDRNKKRFTILKEYGKLCDLTENSENSNLLNWTDFYFRENHSVTYQNQNKHCNLTIFFAVATAQCHYQNTRSKGGKSLLKKALLSNVKFSRSPGPRSGPEKVPFWWKTTALKSKATKVQPPNSYTSRTEVRRAAVRSILITNG